jgi:ABC-2 type transport system ATP-binding protein
VSNGGKSISIQTQSAAATIVELVRWTESRQLKLTDIHMKRPTLEDVFIELTGKKLRE